MVCIQGSQENYMNQEGNYKIKSLDSLKVFEEIKNTINLLNTDATINTIQSKLPSSDAPFLYIEKQGQNYQFFEGATVNNSRSKTLIGELNESKSGIELVLYKNSNAYIPTRELHQVAQKYTLK